MKRVRIIAAILVVLFAIGITSVVLMKKAEPLELPEADRVVYIQTDVFLSKADRYGRKKLSDLMEHMEDSTPMNLLEAKGVERGSGYYALSFVYDDDSRDIFYFFVKDGKWYMETGEGKLYKDVDFITEYTLAESAVMGEAELFGLAVPSLELIEYGVNTEFDMRFYFAVYVESGLERGLTKEDAAYLAKAELFQKYLLCSYALENGYALPEQEKKQYLEEYLAKAKAEENYEEVEKAYEAAGTTFEEAIKKGGMIFTTEIVNRMHRAKRDEFRNGTTTIGDTQYTSAGDYWNGFCLQVITEARGSKGIDQMLERAEEAYNEYF